MSVGFSSAKCIRRPEGYEWVYVRVSQKDGSLSLELISTGKWGRVEIPLPFNSKQILSLKPGEEAQKRVKGKWLIMWRREFSPSRLVVKFFLQGNRVESYCELYRRDFVSAVKRAEKHRRKNELKEGTKRKRK